MSYEKRSKKRPAPKTKRHGQLSIRHQRSLSHPLVKGNPLKAAILETVEDLAFLSLIGEIFRPTKK